MADVSAASLLGPDDPAPVETVRAQGRALLLITCDHASLKIPRVLGDLGVPPVQLREHIGWDIGAAEVTRRLAALLDAPALLTGFSRLVVDCNRRLEDASSIPAASDGVPVPGNGNLSQADRAARVEALFQPYHRAIAAKLDAFLAAGTVPAVISIHSFTPVMNGKARPWHVGILWDKDPRIAVPLLAALRAEPGLPVGDNEPYSAREPVGYTMREHGVARGFPHVALELRQDLIADAQGAAAWAERLARALGPIIAAPDIHRVLRY
ncbi:MAG TPA: N-formylglutamate amidohydrolase [Stellaceae bacterium]|nr:N-formylglutamate amidohydrolase [Stellaceae bacterium]